MNNRTSSQTVSSHEEAVSRMGDREEKGSSGRRGRLAFAWGKCKQVSGCKLKELGKDWFLPNIQSKKPSAFAAAGGEEISRLSFYSVSSESTD